MVDDGWLTQKKNKGFARKNSKDKCARKDINTGDSKEEQCKACGKTFKLIFSHLSRSKNCQMEYDMKQLKEDIQTKRRDVKKDKM